jgi:hypothetical protein
MYLHHFKNFPAGNYSRPGEGWGVGQDEGPEKSRSRSQKEGSLKRGGSPRDDIRISSMRSQREAGKERRQLGQEGGGTGS